MLYRSLADAVVLFHFCFVSFVMIGGLLVLRWRRVMWAHLPAVAWGIYIELSHKICPLTPLENYLREQGGEAAYAGGFVNHYVMPVLYPRGLTSEMQVWIACLIIAINLTCYTVLLVRWRRRRRSEAPALAEAPPAPPAPVVDPADPPRASAADGSPLSGEHASV